MKCGGLEERKKGARIKDRGEEDSKQGLGENHALGAKKSLALRNSTGSR